jgi:hypothetical protein
MNQDANEATITNIYACVVPSEEQVECRIIESTDPTQVGKIFSTAPAKYSVYLVNDSTSNVTSVHVSFGGFEGSEDELLVLPETQKDYGPLKAGEALLLETIDCGLLDFVLWYQLTMHLVDRSSIKVTFSIFKSQALKKDIYHYSPILKEEAYHFSLK